MATQYMYCTRARLGRVGGARRHPEKLSDVVSLTQTMKIDVDLCLSVDYVTRAGLPCDTQNRIGCSTTHTDHNLCSKACKYGMHRTMTPRACIELRHSMHRL